MIQARLAAPRRAALLTTLLLGAAALRALLLPLGDLLSTLVFGIALLGITVAGTSGSGAIERKLSAGKAIAAGLAAGLVLLIPVAAAPFSGRPIGDFWIWAAIAAVIATLEEASIRGVLYQEWMNEAGPLAAIGLGAMVFALIHLPRYGVGAMPLDFAVGLALGGLRAVTGRVLPCAIAHTVADWGAWFWV
jgi:membrane protease YdiL (CAAX protease family)